MKILLSILIQKKAVESQSDNGDCPESLCEDNTAPKEDVFAEGLKYPDCSAVLANNLQNLETQMNNIFSTI